MNYRDLTVAYVAGGFQGIIDLLSQESEQNASLELIRGKIPPEEGGLTIKEIVELFHCNPVEAEKRVKDHFDKNKFVRR